MKNQYYPKYDEKEQMSVSYSHSSEEDNSDQEEYIKSHDSLAVDIPYETKFENFMNKHKIKITDTTTEITHTCMCEPRGKFSIKDEEYDTFLNLYKKVIENRELYIIEKQKEVGPFIIDIDYYTDIKHRERLYRDEHIEKIIKITTKIIKEYFEISNKKDIEAFVFEKDQPSFKKDKSQYKDGFHIIYSLPFHVKHRYFMYYKLKDELEFQKIFDDIKFVNGTTYSDILDKSVIYSNGLIMYGSKKDPDAQIYKITQIYDHLCNKININRYSNDELVVVTSLRKYTNEEETLKLKKKYNDTIQTEINDIWEQNKPNDKKKKKIDIFKDEMREKIDKHTEKHNIHYQKKDEIELSKKLTNILSPERAREFKSWIRVGWVLHNIDESLLDTFIEFSKKCPEKYKDGCCEDVWEKAHSDGLKIGTLHHWASIDNKERYEEIMSERINKSLLLAAESHAHDDIAKIIFELYGHMFKCVSIKKNIWYGYQNHRWILLDCASELAKIISDDLTTELTKLICAYYTNASKNESFEKDTMFRKSDLINKLIIKLKNDTYRKAVINCCAHRFLDRKFEEKIDDNRDIIGFENGVYDLKQGYFRDGLPEDYISMSVKYDYINFKGNEPIINEVKKYWQTVQIKEDKRNYVLRHLASCLDGYNRDQNLIIWTGSGCHSKDTEILMYDGTIKKIQDIKLEDKIMGDNCKSRNVKALFNGIDDMYQIYTKHNEFNFIVNSQHKLALINTFKTQMYEDKNEINENVITVKWYKYLDDIPIEMKSQFYTHNMAYEFLNKQIKENENFIEYGDIISITAEDYCTLKDNIKNDFKLYSNKIVFTTETNQSYDVEPYEYAYRNDIKKTPFKYRLGTLHDRYEFVAGLIDKYGSVNMDECCYIINGNIENNNINFIIKSLGLYYCKNEDDNYVIYGNGIENIILRNVEMIKNNIHAKVLPAYNFYCKKINKDNYYGFELDGNHRYIMENCIVTYNSNGKSTSLDLIECTFGEYYSVFPSTILTRKRDGASNATPELANKRGKRIIPIQETEEDEKIYVGLMKQLTGYDWIETRALYGNPFSYRPQFKLILTCNKLPFISANDNGTWRRLRVVVWDSEFISGPIKKNNQFKKDPELSEKIPKWKEAFIWILLNEYYPQYKANGGLDGTEPPDVRRYTDKYKQDSDIFYDFFSNNTEITGNKNDNIYTQDLYHTFKEIFKNTSSGKCPGKKDFEQYLLKNDNVKIKGSYYIGIKKIVIDDSMPSDVDKEIDIINSSRKSNI